LAGLVLRFAGAGSQRGNDITSQVTGSGWNTGVLQPGQIKDFRIEIGAQDDSAGRCELWRDA